ncbi:hypothetical protein O988_04264 [Pseudogymnoascus sp. VKM F-3808]|nr:hypothetical protein O988_04264 [Pseudogymnoascus sp. VKM F-3808]
MANTLQYLPGSYIIYENCLEDKPLNKFWLWIDVSSSGIKPSARRLQGSDIATVHTYIGDILRRSASS